MRRRSLPKQPDRQESLKEQFSTRFLLPDVVNLIDDIDSRNFDIPAMSNGHLISDTAPDAVPDIDNSQERDTYSVPDDKFPLRVIETVDELSKLRAINALFRAYIGNRTVTVRQLRSVLSTEQLAEYERLVAEPNGNSEILYADGVPEQLKKYIELLRLADFNYGKFERLSSNTNRSRNPNATANVRAAYSRAESQYERALEHLEELYSCAARGDFGHDAIVKFDAWLDRPVDFDKGTQRTIGPDPVQIPRVRGSRSHNSLDAGLPKLSKRLKQQWAALTVLLVAATDIAFVVEMPVDHNTNQLELRERIRKSNDLLSRLNPEKD